MTQPAAESAAGRSVPEHRGVLERVVALGRDVVVHLRGHDLALYAAGLTFYGAVAAVPLALITLYLTGVVIGADTVRHLGEELAGFLPSRLGFEAALTRLVDVGPGLGLAALVAAALPASSYGEGLVRAFDRVSQRPQRTSKGLLGRLLAVALLAALVLAVLAGLLATAALPDFLGTGVAARLAGIYLSFLVGWVIASCLLLLTYRTFGNDPVSGRALLWGAFSTGSFLSGMCLGYLLFLGIDVDISGLYAGSTVLAAVVLFVVWLFLVNSVLLVGYVLTLRVHARGGRPLAPPPAPSQDPVGAIRVRF